jgi:hypothetical protein
MSAAMTLDPATLRRRHDEARARRAPLEPVWRDCADLVLPTRQMPGQEARVYDGTAPDAAEQLAASLLAELTPPWSRWCAVLPGPDVPPPARGDLALLLDRASEALHAAFDASTFAVELNKVEAQHRSLFVAGWRPAIGWVCAGALACYYLPQFALAALLWVRLAWAMDSLPPYPVTEIAGLTELVVALLGLAGLRTVEKAAGKAR